MTKRILLVFFMVWFIPTSVATPWAMVYRKKFAERETAEAAQINTLCFSKHAVPFFTQLLCSWNALRPAKGYLTFYAQARNAHSKKWGAWHRMMEWGAKVQQSHATKSDGFTKYLHVRLETELLQLADAFRIKIVGSKGYLLKNVKGLAVTVVNMREFCGEAVTSKLMQLPSVHVANVPKISQMALNHPDSTRICSPVSCTMLTEYLTGVRVNPITFAQLSYDKGLNAYGSWPFNMAYAFECCKGKNWFYNTRLNSFIEIHQQLLRGLPVIVSVRGALPGAPKPFPLGHLMVVTGWDHQAQEVICHDPSFEEHYQVVRRYKLADFIAAWERSHRLAYWVDPA